MRFATIDLLYLLPGKIPGRAKIYRIYKLIKKIHTNDAVMMAKVREDTLKKIMEKILRKFDPDSYRDQILSFYRQVAVIGSTFNV